MDEKKKKVRIRINGRKCPKIHFLLRPCLHFPNQNILTAIEFGRPTLPNLGGDPIEKTASKNQDSKYVDIRTL